MKSQISTSRINPVEPVQENKGIGNLKALPLDVTGFCLYRKLFQIYVSKARRVLNTDPPLFFSSYNEARVLAAVSYHLKRVECRPCWQRMRAERLGLCFGKRGLLLMPPDGEGKL